MALQRFTINTDSTEAMLDSLSNVELAMVLDGGSAHVIARRKDTDDDWTPGYVDLDGLWLADPMHAGYITDITRWDVQRHY